MEWVETTGRTVDEAKRAALEQLGVGEADADLQVVSEGKFGLFGRLKEEARVRARVQPRTRVQKARDGTGGVAVLRPTRTPPLIRRPRCPASRLAPVLPTKMPRT